MTPVSEVQPGYLGSSGKASPAFVWAVKRSEGGGVFLFSFLFSFLLYSFLPSFLPPSLPSFLFFFFLSLYFEISAFSTPL